MFLLLGFMSKEGGKGVVVLGYGRYGILRWNMNFVVYSKMAF